MRGKDYGKEERERILLSMISSVRHAFRSLTRTPGFTVVAIVTLALGIGASTAIFSVVNAVLLSPLRYGDSAPLVQVQSKHPEQGTSVLTPGAFTEVATTAQSFETVAAQTYYYYNITKIATPARLTGIQATSDYFKLWRVTPLLGRTWNPDETRTSSPPVTVLSEQVWRKHFAANPNLIGQPIWIDDVAVTVIGVMPASFQDPWGNAGIWRPIAIDSEILRERTSRYFSTFARLKSGVTVAQADAELATIGARLRETYPENYRGWNIITGDLKRAIVGDYATGLLVVLGAVGCVMLITCANVAGLNVVRATARRKELAIRTALGASRGQILRQLLTESLLLALAGGVAGVLVGSWGIDALLASVPEGYIPRATEIALNGPVLGGALVLTLVTGLAFGLAPGFTAARVDASDALKATARSSAGPAARRLRSGLVIAEIALAFVLLASAGLLGRSFITILNQRPGIEASRVLSLTVSLPDPRFTAPEKRRDFYSRALTEVAAVPGVEAAGFTNTSPFRWGIPITLIPVGRDGTVDDSRVPQTYYDSVSVDFFRAMGVPLVAGRYFNTSDRAGGQAVVIISETAAKRLFGSENPLGRQVTSAANATARLEVVGVVGDVRREGLASAAPLQAYRPLEQRPTAFATLMVRTALTPSALTKSLQAALARVDPDLPISDIAPMDQVIRRGMTQPRLYLTLFVLFATIALLLAALGLYGLIAYAVAQRTREFGIRTALGASPRDVLALVLREGATLIAIGVALGLAGAFATTRLLEQMVSNTSVRDPLVFGLVPLVLTVVAFAACLLPARRAAKVNPIEALRAE